MATHLPDCANCGEAAAHYVMPHGSAPGYYSCAAPAFTEADISLLSDIANGFSTVDHYDRLDDLRKRLRAHVRQTHVPPLTPWMQGALQVMRDARGECDLCKGRGWGAVVDGERIECEQCGGSGVSGVA